MGGSILKDEELIKAVALEVMGWEYIKWEDFIRRTSSRSIDPVYAPLMTWITKDGLVGEPNFNPLTNLNHAFMVVERMRELGFAVSLCNPWFDGASIERKEWSASFFTEKNAIHGRNQNIGHAICLAALKAVRNG